jgi:hypothetical protein
MLALTRAARLYMHTRQEPDKEIAATVDRMTKRELNGQPSPASGT